MWKARILWRACRELGASRSARRAARVAIVALRGSRLSRCACAIRRVPRCAPPPPPLASRPRPLDDPPGTFAILSPMTDNGRTSHQTVECASLPVRRASLTGMAFPVVLVSFVLFAFLTSCTQETVEEPWLPLDTRDNYLSALHQLELAETYLGETWIRAGAQAVSEPLDVEAPVEEVFLLEPHRPGAVGYRFPARRGRRVTIYIETDVDRFFADVYRLEVRRNAEGMQTVDPDTLIHVASLAREAGTIEFEPRRDNYYILRIQPELLRGGHFTVRFVARAALTFPVEGVGPEGILSFFGDNRDGGARYHEGIDIFAPRGTPLLAASDAVVFRVGWRDRGGNIVSLRDTERDLLFYYAHLDEQLVEEGQRVSAGDVIGTVGNTGNAIATPPHLHIGVYQGGWRGAVDPWEYFVDPPVISPAPPREELLEKLGLPVSVANDVVATRTVDPPSMAPRVINRNPFLNLGPSVRSETGLHEVSRPEPAVHPVARNTIAEVTGVIGTQARVRLAHADGRYGEWIVPGELLVPVRQ